MAEPESFADAIKSLDKTMAGGTERQSGMVGDGVRLIKKNVLGFLAGRKAFQAVKWVLEKRKTKKKLISDQKLLRERYGLNTKEFEFLKEQKVINDKFAETNEMFAKVAKEQIGIGDELEKALLEGQIKAINGAGGLSDVINKSLEASSELYRKNMEQQKARDAATDKRLANPPKTAADKEKAQEEKSKSEKLLEALKGLGEKGKEKAAKVGGSAWDKLKKMFIGAAILGFVALIGAFMNSEMWKTLKKKFQEFSDFFKETILPWIEDVLGPTLFGKDGTFDKLLTDLKIYFDELVAGFKKLLKGDLTGILDIGKSIVKFAINIVDNLVTTVMKLFGVKFEPGETALDKLTGIITDWFASMVAWARNKFGSLATMVFGKETKKAEKERLAKLAKKESKDNKKEIERREKALAESKERGKKKTDQLKHAVEMAELDVEDAEMSGSSYKINRKKRLLSVAKMNQQMAKKSDEKFEIEMEKKIKNIKAKEENSIKKKFLEAETVFQKLKKEQEAQKKASANLTGGGLTAAKATMSRRQEKLDAAKQTRDILKASIDAKRAEGQGWPLTANQVNAPIINEGEKKISVVGNAIPIDPVLLKTISVGSYG